MPVYNANILPAFTGLQLGAPGQTWDIFARNINFSGNLNGVTGLSNINLSNAANADSVLINSNASDGAGMLTRFRITNTFGIKPQVMFKNASLVFGGTNAGDSLIVPENHYAGPTDTGYFARYYKRGDNVNPALDITNLGSLFSYAFGYATWAFALFNGAEVNPRYAITAAAQLAMGAGGATALDVGISRISAGLLGINNQAGGDASLQLLSAHFTQSAGAPFQVDSNTVIPNLNASLLQGSSWAAPGAIGSTTPAAGAFTTVSATGQITSTQASGVPPLVVTSPTPVANLSVQNASDLTVASTLNMDGSGVKHLRFAMASVAANTKVIITVPWRTAFADNGYTVVATVYDPYNNAGDYTVAGVRVVRITGQLAASVNILVINEDATNAHPGCILHVHAFRGF